MTDKRRIHNRVAEIGAESLVDQLLAQGETYESICDLVQQRTGQTIGKSSVARYNAGIQRRLAKMSQMQETAKAITSLFESKTGAAVDTSMSEMLLALMQTTVVDKIGEGDVSNKDLVGLIMAGTKTIQAQSAMEKMKDALQSKYQAAYDRVAAEVKQLLQNEPGLWQQVEEAIRKNQPAA